MLLNFFIILLPLFIGYTINLSRFGAEEKWLKMTHILLNCFIYIILFCMGANLARLDDLWTNLLQVTHYSGLFFVCIVSINSVCLFSYHRFKHHKLINAKNPDISTHQNRSVRIQWHMLLASFWLCFAVFAGFVFEFFTSWSWSDYTNEISQYSLSLLIFLVGIQLRYSKISLKQIVMNKEGLILSIIVATSGLAAGLLAAYLTGLSMKTGLAMASGFGWYSLSGIMITNAYGPLLGSAAFINDLAREILVIILIPIYTARYSTITLGLSGGTAMDFTLPILQKNGGISIVPIAIVQGFLLSLLSIILFTVFS